MSHSYSILSWHLPHAQCAATCTFRNLARLFLIQHGVSALCCRSPVVVPSLSFLPGNFPVSTFPCLVRSRFHFAFHVLFCWLPDTLPDTYAFVKRSRPSACVAFLITCTCVLPAFLDMTIAQNRQTSRGRLVRFFTSGSMNADGSRKTEDKEAVKRLGSKIIVISASWCRLTNVKKKSGDCAYN